MLGSCVKAHFISYHNKVINPIDRFSLEISPKSANRSYRPSLFLLENIVHFYPLPFHEGKHVREKEKERNHKGDA
jgi:hypothetical protein